MSNVTVEAIERELGAASAGGDVSDYFALMKPRVMFLVVFTALVGLVAAPGTMHPVLAIAALACIAAGAGAAGLAVASRCPDAGVTLVENAPEMTAFARSTLACVIP